MDLIAELIELKVLPDDTTGSTLDDVLSVDQQRELGKLIAAQVADTLPQPSVDASEQESVNYSYDFYYGVATLKHEVLVEKLIEVLQEKH